MEVPRIKEHIIRLYNKDMREPLFDYLEERFGKTRMFEEKRSGRSRADIIMLATDSLTGLEIKSINGRRDTGAVKTSDVLAVSAL